MKSLANKYNAYLKNKIFLSSLLSAILLLIVSLVINFYAGLYATERASNYVADIILSNTPVFDVDGIFVYGAIIFWIFMSLFCLLEPKKIPFTAKTIALFILVRSIFISLTHIGPYPTHLIIESNVLNRFMFGGDLFFSGHTGLPFLMALVFWGNFPIRILCIASAILFGLVVLLGHLHYSIDVLAAFFITYTIYHLAEIMFSRDKKLFEQGLISN